MVGHIWEKSKFFVVVEKMSSGEEKPSKRLVVGDDPVDSFEADWLGFEKPAIELTNLLYRISESSGVCCGIIGPWGSGKTSFMKLMEEYAREKSGWENVRTVWFTAWDPGGIQDLGDAMLYRFFRAAVDADKAEEMDKEMAETLKKLEEALGVRRSLRERARRVLEKISPALPREAQVVAATASGFLEELESSSRIRECFDRLMEWLEKKKRTVFLFIDDVDRATGEQIFDLLSELRLYVSRRRVVAVLGYSEDYVIKALGQVLPKEIQSEEYLEKIITVKRNVPTPTMYSLMPYAEALIRHLLPNIPDENILGLKEYAARLSLSNPRKLKRLILTFAQLISSIEHYHKLDTYELYSMLFATAAFDMGLLTDEKVAQTIERGNYHEVEVALQELAEKNPDKRKAAELLIALSPTLVSGSVSKLRLAGVLPSERTVPSETTRREFDWSKSFIPILSSAAKRGLELTSNIAESSVKIVIPQNINVKNFKVETQVRSALREVYKCGCVLSWADSDMFVLLSSHINESPFGVILWFFGECSRFVAEKSFIFWLVDDVGLFADNEDYLKRLMLEAQEKSKGLKNPFVFVYTPYSKVEALLKYLLDVITSPK